MLDHRLIRRLVAPVAAGALALGTLGVATAAEHRPHDAAEEDAVQAVVDLETGTITIALPLDGDVPECETEAAGDGEDATGSDLDAAAAGADDESPTYVAGDCITLELGHPSGKTHHGAVVSTVAKQLHPSMLDGLTKGEIMREIAKVKHVKPDAETDAGSESGPPAHAKDKPSKDNGKDNGNSEGESKGNGKAKGKNK